MGARQLAASRSAGLPYGSGGGVINSKWGDESPLTALHIDAPAHASRLDSSLNDNVGFSAGSEAHEPGGVPKAIAKESCAERGRSAGEGAGSGGSPEDPLTWLPLLGRSGVT